MGVPPRRESELTAFPTTLTVDEIDEIFTLGDDIAHVVSARRTPLTRLGLVLQIGFLRLRGRSFWLVEARDYGSHTKTTDRSSKEEQQQASRIFPTISAARAGAIPPPLAAIQRTSRHPD